MINPVSSLSLVAFAVVSVVISSQDLPPNPVPIPAAPAEANATRKLPSAHAGMLAAMQILEGWGAGRVFDLLEVDSSWVRQKGAEPKINVRFEVRVYGRSPADAQAAFQELERAFARRASEPLVGPLAINAVQRSMIELPLVASSSTQKCFGDSHVGTAQMILIAEGPAEGGSVYPARLDNTFSYIRSVGQSSKVGIGALDITPSRNIDKAWHDENFRVVPSSLGRPRVLGRAQVAKFLLELEEGTSSVVVSSIQFHVTEDEGLARVVLTLTHRVAMDPNE